MRVVLPLQLRADLTALAAGVVNQAQVAYRGRLRLIASDTDDPFTDVETAQVASDGPTLGSVWPLIADVLHRELGDQPLLVGPHSRGPRQC